MVVNVELLRGLGLNLIPCLPKSKLPAINWDRFKEEKYLGVIRDNAAVICGKTSENLVVIDLDSKELKDVVFNDFEGIKKTTLVVETGRGIHVYCRPKGELPPTMHNIQNSAGQKLDIQSQGAYVISPGSIHPSGREYNTISSTTNISEIDIGKFVEHLRSIGFTVSTSLPTISELEKGIEVGNRNNAAFKYACNRIKFFEFNYDMAYSELQVWNSKNKPPLPETELKACFESARKRTKQEPKEPKRTTINEAVENFRNFRDIGAKDEGQIITFECMIGAVDELKSVSEVVTAQCPKCDRTEDIDSEGFVNPKIPRCKPCKINMTFQSAPKTVDMRQILLQEIPGEEHEKQPVVFMGRVIGDNTRVVNVGDRVKLKARYKSINENGSMDNKVVLLINAVEKLDEPDDTELTISEMDEVKKEMKEGFMRKLTTSFAPEILFSDDAKEILLLTLVGGIKHGFVKRPDINTLLIGNPSTGKSELLRFAIKVTPKSTYVNGKTSSGVGLVWSMVKMSDGTSVPTPGVMITNSGGFVAVDEFDKMDDGDRNELLEVMEQQTATLNKAGARNRRAIAKTTVIAAANPSKGMWEKGLPFLQNLDLPSQVFSRFDWLYGFTEVNVAENIEIAKHTLKSLTTKQEKPLFDIDTLRRYLNTVRKLEPKMTDEASDKIRDFFASISQRFSDGSEMPIEKRQMHMLIRASAAHAKLLMQEEIRKENVEEIIRLYKKSCESLQISFQGNQVQTLLEDPRANKDRCVFKAWNECEDEDGLVSKDELGKMLMEKYPNHFPDIYAFQKMFAQHEGKQFLLQLNNRYRLSL